MTALFVRVIERDVLAYRRQWVIFLTGFAEPLLYLLSIGVGVGHLVVTVQTGGQTVDYDAFVAPGLLAAAAMNGAVFDTTFNFFFKYKYARSFDAMLATPLGTTDVAVGELSWALLRGSIYAAAFLVTMAAFGLVESPWAVFGLPAAMLIGFGFAGLGMAATTWMRSFVDFDYVNAAIIVLFLFSATFFPLSRYPTALQWAVQATPLYQGVALERALTLGQVDWTLLLHAAYLAAMGVVGVRIAGTRLRRLLQP
jgi:lipooligosaccharide transport system permease protein